MNMSVAQPRTSTGAPVINFDAKGLSALTGAENLYSLIETFRGAERAIIAADDAFDKIKATLPKAERPRVFGGTTAASTLSMDGRAPITMPASDWYYYSRESIERDFDIKAKDADTDEGREALASKRAELLAELGKQEKAIAKAVPKALRDAERKRLEAHYAFTLAERAIVKLKPANVTEAVALLQYAGSEGRFAEFTADERDLRKIMRNVAATIQSAA